MPEAILAGPDGQPAIDAETGQPLTMEEMLRRGGIMAYKGVVSPLNLAQSTQAAATSADAAVNPAPIDTMVDPSAIAPVEGTALASNSPNGDGTPIIGSGGDPKVAGDGTTTAAAGNPTDEVQDADGNWWPIAAMIAAGATAYGVSKLKRRPGGTGGAAEIVDGTPANLKRVGPTINDSLTLVDPTDVKGSNRQLSSTIDGANVAKAGEIGAGPKALSGTTPVRDTSVDGTSLTDSVVSRKRALNDHTVPGKSPSTRLQQGARQANNSRTQPPGTQPIPLDDKFTDLSPEELTVAKELAARNRLDRLQNEAKPTRRIGQTSVYKAKARAKPSRVAPHFDQASELAEAVAIVRRLKAPGTNMGKIIPRMRLKVP